MEFAFFYLFSTIALISAVMVIWSPSKGNPVHSVLFLVLVFCNATGLLILLEVEFLALLFLVVYVGAIAVLFLFVVMMLAPAEGKMRRNYDSSVSDTSKLSGGFLVVALLLAMIFLCEVFFVVRGNFVALEESVEGSMPSYIGWIQVLDGTGSSTSNLESLGQVLYTYYFYYFIVAGFVLLIAMIGAIVLTLESGASHENKEISFGNIPNVYSQRVQGKGQQIYEQLSRDVQKAVFFYK
jgi:NADH-quinone oxidoreductase subunit J